MLTRTAGLVCGVVAVLFAQCGCGPNHSSTAPVEATRPSNDWFADVTERVRLDFTHNPGPAETYFMPCQVGSGCALFDADGDGRLDILLLQNGGPKSSATNRLFHQNEDGTFTDVSQGSGLDFAGHNMGVAIGDVNNDGKPDVLITQYTGARLFLNMGGNRFREVTEEAGIKDPYWGASAAFFDYDGDGWLDLVIVNYLNYDPSVPCITSSGSQDFCAPRTFPGTPSKLFHNLGPDAAGVPRFEDVSQASGLASFRGPGLGVVCADFTGDGRPDILIANDGQPNCLWVNQGNGKFAEEAVSRGLALTGMGQAYANMGIAVGDVDNDGLLDVYVTHLGSETNTFWRQEKPGLFLDRSVKLKVLSTKWRGTGFGTLLADFDQDGWLDLAIVNGRVNRGTPVKGTPFAPFWEPYLERNQLLANAGGEAFRDISEENPAFCSGYNLGRGLACGDIDDDGAPDLLVTTIAGKARVFKNVVPNRGHWLKVRAVDPKLHREAYGAVVTVRAGQRHWMRVINPAESYLSSSSPEAHFGLGSLERYDSIEVRWPDGARELEQFPGGNANQALVLQRGTGSQKP
jgi:hypothetical protein